MEEGGVSRHGLRETLAKAGWDSGEIAAVMANLHVTYDDHANYEYTSDLRVAREAVAEEMSAFRLVKKGGCCGEYEKSIVALRSDGERSRILVGFNHGH